MGFKKFDWNSWLVVVCVVAWAGLFVYSLCFPCNLSLGSVQTLQWGGVFCFDTVSYHLLVLSGFLWLSLMFFVGLLSGVSKCLLSLSILCSVLSYCSVNAFFFWVFYEMSILPLLLLLVLESPYSERYIASWYLLGYVVLTSLPMLLCLFYMALEFGCYNMGVWGLAETPNSVWVLVLLCILFITKIPLPPFHTWLPIVHAEASSAVSVCLSGYVMKLGVLGVCRFGSFVIPHHVFNEGYMSVILVGGVFFFVCAMRELDGKRWLALLSLSHILVAVMLLSVSDSHSVGYSLVFCLGHGLSAGVIFLLLWVVYEMSGSRNWVVLKSCVSSGLVFRCLCVACLCTASSLPPTLQFFCEVAVIAGAGYQSALFIFLFFAYMFLGGLVPLFLLGTLLSRHVSVGLGSGYVYGCMGAITFLVIFSFAMFLIC